MVAENGWDIPGFFLLVLDTRECNIDLVLLTGIKEWQSVNFLQYPKESADFNLRRIEVGC